MLGALRSVWPFWKMGWRINPLSPDKGLELVLLKPVLPDFFTVDFFISALFLLGGFGLVLLIEYLADKRQAVGRS